MAEGRRQKVNTKNERGASPFIRRRKGRFNNWTTKMDVDVKWDACGWKEKNLLNTQHATFVNGGKTGRQEPVDFKRNGNETFPPFWAPFFLFLLLQKSGRNNCRLVAHRKSAKDNDYDYTLPLHTINDSCKCPAFFLCFLFCLLLFSNLLKKKWRK